MSIKIVPLNSTFDKKGFSCGKEMLDNYFQLQASQDVRRKLCVVFVMADGVNVKGYYTLSNSSIPAEIVPEEVQKKMPKSYENLPVTLLGRLAIDEKFKGQGLGGILLLDAIKKSYEIATQSIGSIAIIVDPLDNEAMKFYLKFGFKLLPGSGKMFLMMSDIAKLPL